MGKNLGAAPGFLAYEKMIVHQINHDLASKDQMKSAERSPA